MTVRRERKHYSVCVYARAHTHVCAREPWDISEPPGSADVIFHENQIDEFEFLWFDLSFALVTE